MKYGIVTTGSRGDVQPFTALAWALKQKGHNVTLMANENFREFVEGYHLNYLSITGNGEEIIQSPLALKLLEGGNIIKFFYHLQKVARGSIQQANQDILNGCKDFDCIITNVLNFPLVYSICEKYRLKMAVVLLSIPLTPTSEFPHQFFSPFINARWLNAATYHIGLRLMWQLIKKQNNEFRKQLQLPKQNVVKAYFRSNSLTLYAMSKELMPQPSDWPSNTHVTGFISLPAVVRNSNVMDKHPGGLEEWLAKGSKPLYIGFGSIPIPNMTVFTQILYKVLDQYRVVFCQGWSVLPVLLQHPDLFVVKQVNHEWLLPQCSTAIIHGGIGTIAAVMRAGIPVVVVSVLADQPHNAAMVVDKKIGLHIPFKKFGFSRLITALAITHAEEMVRTASQVGMRVVNENGLEQCVTLIEAYFGKQLFQDTVK